MRLRHGGTTLGVGLAFALAAGTALAGPCSDEIAALSAQLGAGPTMGAAPSATGAPSGQGAAQGGGRPAVPQAGGMPAQAGSGGTPGGNHPGGAAGTAGTRAMNQAVGPQVATSPEDVRRQQMGQPTAAATAEAALRGQSPDRPGGQAAPGASDSRMALARTELESARALDGQNDRACMDALGRVRQLLQQQPR
jgi:hypothetical protein